MSLICVGVSYRSAEVPLLERLSVPAADAPGLLSRLLARVHVGEAVVLSTCNRVEVYAEVAWFHGGLADIASVLAERAGAPVNDLAPHLYVHFDAEAVRHAFRVAAGLDSMVVGEPQVLGQLREAYTAAADHGATGRVLHELMQQALRVGKRAHTETGIDRAGQNVVAAALARGEAEAGPVAGRSALVIGAGAMGALALASLRRAGADPLFVANRGFDRAVRLAAGHDATAVPLGDLPAVLSRVGVVVTATASPEPVLLAPAVAEARRAVGPGGRPLLVLDLAIPRDVGPGVAALPGVVVVDIARLSAPTGAVAAGAVGTGGGGTGTGSGTGIAVRAAEQLVSDEVETFLTWLRSSAVVPTVAALRARADDLVTTELRRLGKRRPELTDEQRAEVARTVHRVVQRLLHSPSVRVRELAAGPGGESYAQALRELFDLQVPAGMPTGAALGGIMEAGRPASGGSSEAGR